MSGNFEMEGFWDCCGCNIWLRLQSPAGRLGYQIKHAAKCYPAYVIHVSGHSAVDWALDSQYLDTQVKCFDMKVIVSTVTSLPS